MSWYNMADDEVTKNKNKERKKERRKSIQTELFVSLINERLFYFLI